MQFKLYFYKIFFLIICFILISSLSVHAASRVKFGCSAQIAEAFGKEVVKLLKDKTGLELDLKIVSSKTAINRLENGFSEIAAITVPLSYDKHESGYVAIPFCKDPITIVTGLDNGIDNISSENVTNIFSGSLGNWKELGGNDKRVTKVVPCAETGAYLNFSNLFMGMKKIQYDFMTYCSVTTLSGVASIQGSVSFISHGAAVKSKGIKILKVDGVSPLDKKYKFYQTFIFVTKGLPTGPAKELIDIAFSKVGKEVMESKGMSPILR